MTSPTILSIFRVTLTLALLLLVAVPITTTWFCPSTNSVYALSQTRKFRASLLRCHGDVNESCTIPSSIRSRHRLLICKFSRKFILNLFHRLGPTDSPLLIHLPQKIFSGWFSDPTFHKRFQRTSKGNPWSWHISTKPQWGIWDLLKTNSWACFYSVAGSR